MHTDKTAAFYGHGEYKSTARSAPLNWLEGGLWPLPGLLLQRRRTTAGRFFGCIYNRQWARLSATPIPCEPRLYPMTTTTDKHHFNAALRHYLDQSPTPFHAVRSMVAQLTANGFRRLQERDDWQLLPGKYFVTRNDSSLIAFVLGQQDLLTSGLRIVGAHTDSPCLKVKPNPENRLKGYLNIGVEVYGGVLLNPWFDRDLSLAGRVTFQTPDNQLQSRLINFQRTIGTIPSLAIHLDREANNERKINPQTDIPPLLMQAGDQQTLDALLTQQLETEHPGVRIKRIMSHELSFFDTNGAAQSGFNGEFIASARLDNLLSCYTGITSLLAADPDLTSMVVCNDHEEVGSTSAEGAQGTLLKDVLQRLLPVATERQRCIARSMFISTDNAHGVHPNYAAKHDANHGPLLNGGPVIKVNANQRYATNSETAAYFAALCEQVQVPCQTFVTRTDMACGSTIGPLTAKEIGIRTLDVGVPTFAMHSIRELAGSDDAHYLHRVLCRFFQDGGELGVSQPQAS
jgi:aspartyl aminopeptidase